MTQNLNGQFIHGKANYNGNVVDSFDKTQPYGPNDNGEYMWFVEAEYFPDRNKTVAYFSLNPPQELSVDGS